MEAGVTFAELLAYNDEENRRWQEWFRNNEKALDLPLDIAGTVGGLVHHIFETEWFFAASVLSRPIGALGDDKPRPLRELFSLGNEASAMLHEFVATASPEQWTAEIEMRFGLRVSRRKCVLQALTHSMRHWAQIATFLRQHGMPQEWRHDVVLSDAIR